MEFITIQFFHKMAGNNLSVDGQFRYICQWFTEWSELQREDFIPILADCLKGGPTVYMNGVVNELANSGCNDKPMSLFQCRIKLFKEWTPKWTEDLKLKLKEKVIELDGKIGEKLNEELSTVITNGNGLDSDNELAEEMIENDENFVVQNGHNLADNAVVEENLINEAVINVAEPVVEVEQEIVA